MLCNIDTLSVHGNIGVNMCFLEECNSTRSQQSFTVTNKEVLLYQKEAFSYSLSTSVHS